MNDGPKMLTYKISEKCANFSYCNSHPVVVLLSSVEAKLINHYDECNDPFAQGETTR